MPAAAGASATLASIVVDLVARCTPARTFDDFTRDVGRWWPLASHWARREKAEDFRCEPRGRGGLVET